MMPMRMVVTGKSGQVARSLLECGQGSGFEVIAIGRPELDLANISSIEPALRNARPDIIVSAAAYTAVDLAESQRLEAFATNAAGAGAVALAANKLGVPIIHLSTDYVFNGVKPGPWLETDPTEPLSVYGESKWQGEQQVASANPDHIIMRTAWVYSPFGANFVRTMLKMGMERDEMRVVADQFGCPTSAHDIAGAILGMARNLKADRDGCLRGIFHLAAQGEANWAQFAEAIFARLAEKTGRIVKVTPITTAEFPRPAMRPANSRLDCAKLKARHGIELPHWRGSLQLVVDRLLEPAPV